MVALVPIGVWVASVQIISVHTKNFVSGFPPVRCMCSKEQSKLCVCEAKKSV